MRIAQRQTTNQNERTTSGDHAGNQTDQRRAGCGRPSRRAGPAVRPHVIWAVFKRNFLSYFSNPPATCSSRCSC